MTMTTSELIAPPDDQHRAATLDTAYARALVALHRSLRYPELPSTVGAGAVSRVEQLGDGLTTIAFSPDAVGQRHLQAVFGFRLAEFVDLAMMSSRLARETALLAEPPDATVVHTVCLDAEGRILGYVGLLGSRDVIPRRLDDPARSRYPVESAHGVDLLTPFADQAPTTHQVFEIKRFVRAGDVPAGQTRDRVPWHLILALGRSVLTMGRPLLIGDSRENGALRHLRLVGFDPLVIPDTKPALPRTSLMWSSYLVPDPAVPFASLVPDDLASYLDAIEEGLAGDHDPTWQRRLLARLSAVRRERPRVGPGPGEEAS
ncbi:hypothetical protein GA0070624_0662 [Micromonospora rhizosphaerae]|uniref:Uncharacterized protein n=2 Tax=Micromonospora rhizosphaerae TaxID=568872 RepID=A0A1C6RDW0_9ACTN|nr:hypothetical protein GA0070624_0662 [Micromonospora rhizosphaerae]